jgi:hypothetical protein
MYAKGENIHIGFSNPYDVTLAEIGDADDLVLCARRVTSKLLEEKGNTDYLAERFIRLSAKILGLQVNPSELYQKHSIVVIHDAIINTNKLGVIRFENGKGKFAGHHFVELSAQPKGKLQVVRNMIGNPGHTQQANIDFVHVEYLASHILLSLDPNLSWSYSNDVERSNWNWYYATRIALSHNLTETGLAKVKDLMASVVPETSNNAIQSNLAELELPPLNGHKTLTRNEDFNG